LCPGRGRATKASIMTRVRSTLESLRDELLGQIAPLKAQLEPLEAELADVQTALTALGFTPSRPAVDPAPKAIENPEPTPRRLVGNRRLILAVLRAHPEGLTNSEIVEALDDAFGHKITRANCSWYLTHLKNEHQVIRGENGLWLAAHKDEAPPGLPLDGAPNGSGSGNPASES
jgi:hypothetical protein